MRIDDFLSNDAFVQVNKKLAKILWIQKAYYLQELISQRKRFKSDLFYITQNKMYQYLWINQRTQINYIKSFIDMWLLSVEKRGMPCKNWYKINDDKIFKLMWDHSDDEDEECECEIETNDDIIVTIQENTEKTENNNNRLFDEFRDKYPRKVWKKDAMKKFNKLKRGDQELAIKMIEVFKKTKQWQNEQYIPHPTTYINQERFRDEVETVSNEVDGKQSKYANDDRYIYDEKTWMYKLKPRMF